MEVIYYTRETAPHAPVFSVTSSRSRHPIITPLGQWEAEHRRIQALPPDALKAHMQDRKTYYWPPCAACDWDQVQKDPDLAKARVEIKRRVRTFQASGKLPPGWMLPKGVSFGMAILSDEACRKVIIPHPIRYYSTEEIRSGKVPVPDWSDLHSIERVVEKYLLAMGERKTEKYRPERQNQYYQAPERQKWSCGCETAVADGSREGDPCPKHKRALEGRDDD